MKAWLTLGSVAIAALAVAGCTTTGVGTGQSIGGNLTANFTWTENGGTNGTMIAQLSNGAMYQGVFFQITQETSDDSLGPLWNGWGAGFGWHRPWGRFGWGWGGWDAWGPYPETITHYSGQVLANLQGPSGYMRCHFTLARPSFGMSGGGLGQCQLPNGPIINAQFPPHS